MLSVRQFSVYPLQTFFLIQQYLVRGKKVSIVKYWLRKKIQIIKGQLTFFLRILVLPGIKVQELLPLLLLHLFL